LEEDETETSSKFRKDLEAAESYADVWRIVKDTAGFALKKQRGNMMLFLDDLPLQLGAYHPVGTNNIVLNRTLVEIVETQEKSKVVVNSLVYNLLLHEYLHAMGEYSETEVRRLVVVVATKCFGRRHIVTNAARKSPWVLLKHIPITAINAPKRVMQIVRDFEKTSKYVV
jgi:hypothetical protein